MITQSSSEPTTGRRPMVEQAGNPVFLNLAAKVFWGSIPVRTVAVVACHRGEGTTFVSHALQAFLEQDGRSPVSLRLAPDFLASASHERSSDYLDTTGRNQDHEDSNRITLVDCPALFSSSTALRVASRVDGVLLVVEDGTRSKAEIQRAVSILESAEGRVLGVVLNKRRYLLPNWLYTLLT